jgi:hypothetical protein
MPDRPLLNLPPPEPFTLLGRGGGGAPISRPTPDRQRALIDPRFERLSRVAANPEQLLSLREDPASIAPERAIVFEVIGPLEDFYAQARSIGLEYLADHEDEFVPSDAFYNEKHPEKALTGRLYLAMPDVQALRELLSLWSRYKNNQRMPPGRAGWRELFSSLVDVRPWGPQDRISDETLAVFAEDLARAPDAPVRFEVEFWYHENAERRVGAIARLTADVDAAGGRVVDHVVVHEIHYDAALVDLPAAAVRALVDHPDVGLALADDVMFLRPQSVARSLASEIEGETGRDTDSNPIFVSNEPRAALLDGLSIENHARLAGRLRVDDPGGLPISTP